MIEGLSSELSDSFEAARAASMAAHASRPPVDPRPWHIEIGPQVLDFPDAESCARAASVLRAVGVTGRRVVRRPANGS